MPGYAGNESAYQILVSSNEEKLALNVGDVWDSGEIRNKNAGAGNQEFAGTGPRASSGQNDTLKPNIPYFWKVRIWDKDNRVSDYSQSEKFTN